MHSGVVNPKSVEGYLFDKEFLFTKKWHFARWNPWEPAQTYFQILLMSSGPPRRDSANHMPGPPFG